MSIHTSRAQRRQMARENARQPATLTEVPRHLWPDPLAAQLRVLRSREFLVQEFEAQAPAVVRLSINRVELAGDRWVDGISWEELQRIKSECGYGQADAVEIYPPKDDEVNVANMRHLWVLRDPLSFAWRSHAALQRER